MGCKILNLRTKGDEWKICAKTDEQMNKIKDSKYCNDFWDKISEEDRKKQGEMDLREEKIKK